MSRHTDFIFTPISNILMEVVTANAGIGNGVETFPLSEYIMQSVFLKMTGSQEQKMKCICWELATSDYEYRYKRYTQKPLGECSTYEEKKTIYKDLIDLIKKYKSDFDITTEIDKDTIKTSTLSVISEVFSNSNLSSWSESTFLEFMNDITAIPLTQFATPNNLFENVLQGKYALLYNHRNRCAHNTFSYQENLPTLKTLINENHQYDNYVWRFSLLILIDSIFVKLYGKYREAIRDN